MHPVSPFSPISVLCSLAPLSDGSFSNIFSALDHKKVPDVSRHSGRCVLSSNGVRSEAQKH